MPSNFPCCCTQSIFLFPGDSEWSRGYCPLLPTWGFTCCWRLCIRGCAGVCEGKEKSETWSCHPLHPSLLLAGNSQTSRGRDAAGAQGQSGSSKVHPVQDLSTDFSTQLRICNNGVSCKAWLAKEGEIYFVLFPFFFLKQFSNCASAWQS